MTTDSYLSYPLACVVSRLKWAQYFDLRFSSHSFMFHVSCFPTFRLPAGTSVQRFFIGPVSVTFFDHIAISLQQVLQPLLQIWSFQRSIPWSNFRTGNLGSKRSGWLSNYPHWLGWKQSPVANFHCSAAFHALVVADFQVFQSLQCYMHKHGTVPAIDEIDTSDVEAWSFRVLASACWLQPSPTVRDARQVELVQKPHPDLSVPRGPALVHGTSVQYGTGFTLEHWNNTDQEITWESCQNMHFLK